MALLQLDVPVDVAVEKRVDGLTFGASYGESLNGNYIETFHMSAYTECPTTTSCEILLYLLITFCAYMAKTQSLSSTTVCEIATTASVITLTENILTLNNQRPCSLPQCLSLLLNMSLPTLWELSSFCNLSLT